MSQSNHEIIYALQLCHFYGFNHFYNFMKLYYYSHLKKILNLNAIDLV